MTKAIRELFELAHTYNVPRTLISKWLRDHTVVFEQTSILSKQTLISANDIAQVKDDHRKNLLSTVAGALSNACTLTRVSKELGEVYTAKITILRGE